MRPVLRLSIVATTLVATVFVACNPERDALAPRRPGRLGSGVPIADSAVMQAVWAQKVKGWGIYPVGDTNPITTAIADSLFSMHEQFVREQLDPRMYISGNMVSNMVIDTIMLNKYIAKLNSAKSHGIDSGYIMSVWSPPASMKVIDTLTGLDSNSLDSASMGAYVAFLSKVMVKLSSSTVGLPKALSVANEPDYTTPKYSSSYYTPHLWDSVMIDTRGSFNFWGATAVRLFGPETQNYINGPSYFGGSGFPFITTGGTGTLNAAVNAYAIHSYGQCHIDNWASDIAGNPRDAWQTEMSVTDTGLTQLEYAFRTFESIGADFILGSANYWFWWTGYAQDTAAPGGQVLMSGTTAHQISPRYFALKQLWSMVRPGWSVKPVTFVNDTAFHIVLGSQTPCANGGHAWIDLMTFVNNANDSVVVVLVNRSTSDKSMKIGTFDTTYHFQHSWRTDATHNMVGQTGTNVFNGSSTVQVPASSIVLALMYHS